MTTPVRWRKANRSQDTSNCVEVASTLDHLRDSKNSNGPTLRVDVVALVQAVQAGNLRPRA